MSCSGCWSPGLGQLSTGAAAGILQSRAHRTTWPEPNLAIPGCVWPQFPSLGLVLTPSHGLTSHPQGCAQCLGLPWCPQLPRSWMGQWAPSWFPTAWPHTVILTLTHSRVCDGILCSVWIEKTYRFKANEHQVLRERFTSTDFNSRIQLPECEHLVPHEVP